MADSLTDQDFDRVFAPDLDGPLGGLEDDAARQPMIFGLIVAVLTATGGGLFTIYEGGPAPVIAAPPGPIKETLAPPDAAPGAGDLAVYDVIEGRATGIDAEAPIDLRPPPLEAASTPRGAPSPPDSLTPSPVSASDGAWLAQIAALRSEPAARAAWRRFSEAAPQAFSGLDMDIERADLGPRGVYFRLRAAGFEDRAAAGRFCESVKALGQDCIVVGQ